MITHSDSHNGGTVKTFRFFFALLAAFICTASFAKDITFTSDNLEHLLNPQTTKSEAARIPIFISYPSNFTVEKRDINGLGMTFIKSPTTDVDSFLDLNRPSDVGEGAFTISLSQGTKYIYNLRLFSDERESDERESGKRDIRSQMEKLGFTDIVVRRIDRKSLRIAERTGIAPNGRKSYIAYVNYINGGPTLRFIYYHPAIYRPLDELIWQTFLDGLAGQ
jgi:hypothetical protein